MLASSMAGEPIAEITAYGPHWSVWYGRMTGTYWAVPNWPGAPGDMIQASDVGELDEKMTAVEQGRQDSTSGSG